MFDKLSEDQRQALNIVREGHNQQQQQQHKLYLHDFNYLVTVSQKL